MRCLSVAEVHVGMVLLNMSPLPGGYILRGIYHADGHLVQAKAVNTFTVLVSQWRT